VAQGKKNASDIRNYFSETKSKYSPGSFPMQFITNHDENSHKGTEYERMSEAVKTFAALTFTIEGIPLLYSGQEAGLNKRLLFFEKDTINWSNLEMQKFYQKLVSLKHTNAALWNGTAGGPMVFAETSVPEKVLAFSREKDNDEVLSVFNFSAEPIDATVQIAAPGNYLDYFSGENITLEKNAVMNLGKWGYRILIRK
jgi:glycosidase